MGKNQRQSTSRISGARRGLCVIYPGLFTKNFFRWQGEADKVSGRVLMYPEHILSALTQPSGKNRRLLIHSNLREYIFAQSLNISNTYSAHLLLRD